MLGRSGSFLFTASLLAVVAVVDAACSSAGGDPAASGTDAGNADGTTTGTDGGGPPVDPGDAGPYYELGLNDVTILTPLPAASSPTTPVLLRGGDLADDGTAFVPRALFDRVTEDKNSPGGAQFILAPEAYADLHLVAVRFDLCDRKLPGACPAQEDGRMRLVFQPVSDKGEAFDAGFHAFYRIANNEIASAIAALRDLARSSPTRQQGQTGILRPSPALSSPTSDATAAYTTKLRAFVKRFGGEGRILRLTLNAQPLFFAQIRWALRGVEKKDGAGPFIDMPMLGSTETAESVILSGNPGYEVTPATDTPTGLAGAITKNTFDGANATQQRDYLAALAAVDNPMTHSAETVACVACHVSTVIMAARAPGAGIDPSTLPGRYISTRYDLSVAGGKSRETTTVIRALGYIGTTPLISQRVVNDTAQTLVEIEARYP